MRRSSLRDYKKVVGKDIIKGLYDRAEKLKGKHIVMINSTYQGGGVAEILNSIVPLFNEIDVYVGWRILHGSADFFTITKRIHNALQGEKMKLSERSKKIYCETNKRFASFTHIRHDLVVVHDPQPLPLINFYDKKQPWVWRLHIDTSSPNLEVWNYLKKFVEKYDYIVSSKREYVREDLDMPIKVIPPAIDPLTLKNKKISEKTITKYLDRYGIHRDKPIISQISRFDKWKDPLGVIKIFEKVRKKRDVSLVLLGSMATDDPEGQKIYEKVRRAVERSKYKRDIKVLMVASDILVNALQRASDVVIQKSLREGFGLVVSEALYKGTPVVASNVGGIPYQVIDGINGFLHRPKDYDGFAESVIKLLDDDELRMEMGAKGIEHIRNNFLITRLMKDWMDLFIELLDGKEEEEEEEVQQ